MLDPRENSNSSKEAPSSTDFPLKSMEIWTLDEEMREIRDLTISVKPSQSARDSSTISIFNYSTLRKSISGTKNGKPTSFSVESDISLSLQIHN